MNNDILDKRRLNEQPNQYDQGDQNQQYGAGYFPECFQLRVVRCKFMFSLLLRKSNTSKSLNLNIWLQIIEIFKLFWWNDLPESFPPAVKQENDILRSKE